MIAIRADANAEIGSGHISRCLAIATELKRLGQEVIFITADGYPAQIIKQAGIKNIVLNSNWKKPDEETTTLIATLKAYRADTILIDSYCISSEYLKKLNPYVVTVYIDDFGEHAFPVDILINYNIYSDQIPYLCLYGAGTRLLLGTKYAPLRAEFRYKPYMPVRDRITRILVTTGGTDPYEVSYALCERILKDPYFKEVGVTAAFGQFYKDSEKLIGLSNLYPRLSVVRNIPMSELMMKCDTAISAGGTTLYELCACGTPSVIFGFADNQMRAREGFDKKGIMIDCGDVRSDAEACLSSIIHTVKSLEGSKKAIAPHASAQSLRRTWRCSYRPRACLSFAEVKLNLFKEGQKVWDWTVKLINLRTTAKICTPRGSQRLKTCSMKSGKRPLGLGRYFCPKKSGKKCRMRLNPMTARFRI